MIFLVVPQHPAKTASDDIRRDEAIAVHSSHTRRAEKQGPFLLGPDRLRKRHPLGRYTLNNQTESTGQQKTAIWADSQADLACDASWPHL